MTAMKNAALEHEVADGLSAHGFTDTQFRYDYDFLAAVRAKDGTGKWRGVRIDGDPTPAEIIAEFGAVA